MRMERIVLSFVAVIVGLLVATGAFFIYQSTKTIPSSKIPTITIPSPSPQAQSGLFLTIDGPIDESVVASRTLTVNGKTTPDATIVFDSLTDDQVVTPAATGNFSITATINPGENVLTLTAIGKDGEEVKKTITITQSTENF